MCGVFGGFRRRHGGDPSAAIVWVRQRPPADLALSQRPARRGRQDLASTLGALLGATIGRPRGATASSLHHYRSTARERWRRRRAGKARARRPGRIEVDVDARSRGSSCGQDRPSCRWRPIADFLVVGDLAAGARSVCPRAGRPPSGRAHAIAAGPSSQPGEQVHGSLTSRWQGRRAVTAVRADQAATEESDSRCPGFHLEHPGRERTCATSELGCILGAEVSRWAEHLFRRIPISGFAVLRE